MDSYFRWGSGLDSQHRCTIMAHLVAGSKPFRTTQRAPRSCRSCATRKVKCDKQVPCSTCIKRGEADACTREMVIVRGEVRMWQDAPHIPTHEDLNHENQRLRLELEALRAQNSQVDGTSVESPSVWPKRQHRSDHDEEGLEDRLWKSLSAASTATRPAVSHWTDIVLPSRACSEQLIAYDKTWNSWVHYAVEYPRFENECNGFISAMEAGSPIERQDPSWMAVYFSVLSAALLMMADNEAETLILPGGFGNRRDMSRIWYDAAIFALSCADFMRVPSIRTVQAVAVLGMCFNTWGDIDLGQHMWRSALLVAQKIGLNTPYSRVAGSCLSEEAQHRLWWTLVICEWLNLPYLPPVIDDVDFDVPLPRAMSRETEESIYDQVHYHIFMARSAIVVYRFRARIRSGIESHELTKAVRSADHELAQIIDTLPPHLQPDIDPESDELRRLESSQPWIKWQRYDLTLVLLHLRLRLHRTLQAQWLADHDDYGWAEAVSVSSAMSVIWINRNWDQPSSLRKQWALSHHIFVSAILLVHQCQTNLHGEVEEYHEAIHAAINLLESVKSWNMLANLVIAILDFDSYQ
ncbi:hypothetical protein BJY01DRAFT_245071 [Aspergillus pseudoustus]|uniref:Zn(2)-C6 fungal-type domain-containing protein n=1 Tax=Aspergillus pseudoustus TaxID=1810923 RepID=A0ABR4KFS6_9EURO